MAYTHPVYKKKYPKSCKPNQTKRFGGPCPQSKMPSWKKPLKTNGNGI